MWDVGGQQTIRSYWRNYFEQTDGLIWVVDSSDRWRMEDCKRELHNLLDQEKLAGASLLIFANKQDLAGALTAEEVRSTSNAVRARDSTTSHVSGALSCARAAPCTSPPSPAQSPQTSLMTSSSTQPNPTRPHRRTDRAGARLALGQVRERPALVDPRVQCGDGRGIGGRG